MTVQELIREATKQLRKDRLDGRTREGRAQKKRILAAINNYVPFANPQRLSPVQSESIAKISYPIR